jgi:hypothetical protein
VPELSDLTDAAGAGLRSPGSTCAGKGEIAVCGRGAYVVPRAVNRALAAGDDPMFPIYRTKDE